MFHWLSRLSYKDFIFTLPSYIEQRFRTSEATDDKAAAWCREAGVANIPRSLISNIGMSPDQINNYQKLLRKGLVLAR